MRILFSYVSLFLLLSSLTVSSSSYAAKPYLDKNRMSYISSVLQAFSETPINKISNTYSYINVVERNSCRSSNSDLTVGCLLSYAKNNCAESGNAKLISNCELYSDIIVVNKLSEKIFVSRSERYRMLKNTSYDFRTAMANRLDQKYARMVTQFYLSEDSDCKNDDVECLGEGLDQFCLDYTNRNSLSWQYCMSATLWFIGTSKKY